MTAQHGVGRPGSMHARMIWVMKMVAITAVVASCGGDDGAGPPDAAAVVLLDAAIDASPPREIYAGKVDDQSSVWTSLGNGTIAAGNASRARSTRRLRWSMVPERSSRARTSQARPLHTPDELPRYAGSASEPVSTPSNSGVDR